VLDLGDVLAAARGLTKVELDHLAPTRGFDPLDLLELLHPRLHLRGVARAGLEAGDEGLLLGEHGLLPRELRLLLGREHGPLTLVEVVVAREGRELAAVDLDDLGHEPVHELAVVRGHHDRALEALQELFEPQDRLDVEVVRRLVEEERVGALQEDLRERHAHLPAPRERAHVVVHHVLDEAEAREDLPRARLERVAVELFEAGLRVAVRFENRLHRVGARRVAHRELDRVERVRRVGHLARSGHGLFDHGAARHLAHVLREVPDGRPPVDRHLAAVGEFIPDDHAKDGGLARTVGADEADLLAAKDPHRGFEKENLRAVLLRDLIETNHARAL
jgi:hypothetical protein